jgi:hypothetical protein
MTEDLKSIRGQASGSFFWVSIVGALVVSGCSTTIIKADPCESANKAVSFPALLQNSMHDVYNACLDSKRDAIVKEWRGK